MLCQETNQMSLGYKKVQIDNDQEMAQEIPTPQTEWWEKTKTTLR